jgi:hypothetical protein
MSNQTADDCGRRSLGGGWQADVERLVDVRTPAEFRRGSCDRARSLCRWMSWIVRAVEAARGNECRAGVSAVRLGHPRHQGGGKTPQRRARRGGRGRRRHERLGRRRPAGDSRAQDHFHRAAGPHRGRLVGAGSARRLGWRVIHPAFYHAGGLCRRGAGLCRVSRTFAGWPSCWPGHRGTALRRKSVEPVNEVNPTEAK